MTDLRTLLAAGLAAVLLLLATAAPAEAQVVVNRGFNPRTGRVNRSVVAYNPWTGRYVRAGRRGWVGPPVRRGVVYSPWVAPPVVVAPNPWARPVVWGAPVWRGW
jgi:hypothetical protein